MVQVQAFLYPAYHRYFSYSPKKWEWFKIQALVLNHFIRRKDFGFD
jgi:hypothetical protein